MKLAAHVEEYQKSIDNFLEKNKTVIQDYEHGKFFRSDRVKDLNKRFRWDVFYRINNTVHLSFTDALYTLGGISDDIIDTLLKRCTPKIERKY